ncbi:MAG: hypothetical protein ACI9Y7_001279 [Dokdonia sp.]|jgi:hypothetical protein
MKKLIFIILISLSLVQCNSDENDCSLVLCIGPEFAFEFIDADTGENLLEGSFNDGAPDGFFVAIGEDNTPLTFGQDYGVNSGRLSIFRFVEQIQVSYDTIFDVEIAYDIETISDGNCCQEYRYENITVTNATFEQVENETALILRIFI